MAWKILIQLLVLIGFFTKEIRGNDDIYRCPEHLSRTIYLKTLNEKCYRYEKGESYWTTARSRCRGEGGDLIQIRNQATQNWVISTLNDLHWNTNGVWIGAHDRDNEMDWRWVTGDKITWNYWASGQPNCNFFCVEDCGNLRRDDGGRWHDYLCSLNTYSYVCQYDMKPATTTTIPTTTTTTKTTPTTMTNTTTPTTVTVNQLGELSWMIVAIVLGAIVILMLLSVCFFRMRKKKSDIDKSMFSSNSRISKHEQSLNDPVRTGNQNVCAEPNESVTCQAKLPNVSVIAKECGHYSEILEQKMDDKLNVYLQKYDNDEYENCNIAKTSKNQYEECGNVDGSDNSPYQYIDMHGAAKIGESFNRT